MTPEEVLGKYWGHSAFRPLQREIITSVLEGTDVLALLPTGGGKSVCYQVPGVILSGLTLVISPLIALMKDQVGQLNAKGLKAQALYSGLNQREIDIVLDNCAYGDIKFLYVSPERLGTELFKARLHKLKVSLVAVDEAHCISLWGYDFRPPYLEIAQLRKDLPGVPFVALTATATDAVCDDIVFRLGMNSEKRFRMSFERSNLSYSVRKTQRKLEEAARIIEKVPGTAIIYTNSRKECREIALFLANKGIRADYYHAGLTAEQRSVKQDAWIKGHIRVIVATNAFGMGIDKPDVRLVIHMHIPSSPEAYYQEAGRGGRDGARSYSVILWSDADKDYLKKEWEFNNPDHAFLIRIYQAAANYLKVAVGVSGNIAYPFDLNAFSERYSFQPRQAFYALKKLENEGLILLNEPFENPSRIWILLDRTDLYKYQVENKKLDPLIKGLLRLYGGEAFSQYVNLNEDQLAKVCNMDRDATVKALRYLHAQKVVDYSEQLQVPHLTFISQRFDPSNLPVDTQGLRARRQNEWAKIEAMTDYVENEHRCRNQSLLAYFGEELAEHCGKCDICLSQKRQTKQNHYVRYREHILGLLAEGPAFPESFETTFEENTKDIVDEVVRDLLDEGLIQYNEHWQLILCKE